MSAETNATPAAGSGEAPSLENIGATLTSVSDGLTTAFMQLEELQGALRGGCQELASRQQQLLEREAQLQLRIEELQRRIDDQQAAQQSAQQALDAQRTELDRQRETLQVQQAQLEEQQAAATQAVEVREREFDARQQEAEQARLALAEERSRFEEERAAWQQQITQVEQRGQELDAREQQIEQRLQELAQAQANLEKRHQAVARFQKAFSEMAASLGIASPNLPELESSDSRPAESATQGALPQADLPPPEAAATARSGAAKGQTARSESVRPPEIGDRHARLFDNSSMPGDPEEQAEPGAPQTENGSDSIDEAALPPDVLSRLRVLRRLTGGKVADTLLLERIRQERGVADQHGAKQKRRWWG